uniref:Uncharacterized protein n=1 Tax=Parastrongyloides trichosuri TaxID=131310 RepID=A0A0N4ZWE0_PARTI
MKILIFLLLILQISVCHYQTIKQLEKQDNTGQKCSTGCRGLCYNKNIGRIMKLSCCDGDYCGCCTYRIRISNKTPYDGYFKVSRNYIKDNSDKKTENSFVKTLSKDRFGNSDEEISILNYLKETSMEAK